MFSLFHISQNQSNMTLIYRTKHPEIENTQGNNYKSGNTKNRFLNKHKQYITFTLHTKQIEMSTYNMYACVNLILNMLYIKSNEKGIKP